MRINYQLEPTWPRFSWLAICRPGFQSITVRHGADVEIRRQWFCEAIWNDDFEQGGIDMVDLVYGSGGRIRNGRITFVSSASSCDRLHAITSGTSNYISNSLVCLTSVLDANVDPWYPWYYEDLAGFNTTIERPNTYINTCKGRVSLYHGQNLAWSGSTLEVIEKPTPGRRFVDFDDYHAFLQSSLKSMFINMHAPGRVFPFDSITFQFPDLLSLATNVLIRESGCRDAISLVVDKQDAADSIRKLELNSIEVGYDTWRKTRFAEIPFIAADACGRDAWLYPVSNELRRRVFFTGFCGNDSWHLTSPDTRRNDSECIAYWQNGRSLGEYRLLAGFIHCPIASIGDNATASIKAISNSEEMQPWRTNASINQSIPRRLAEEAGMNVGQTEGKKLTGVVLYRREEFNRYFGNTDSMHNFMAWIRQQNRSQPPPSSRHYERASAKQEVFEVPMVRQIFPWAVAQWKQQFFS